MPLVWNVRAYNNKILYSPESKNATWILMRLYLNMTIYRVLIVHRILFFTHLIYTRGACACVCICIYAPSMYTVYTSHIKSVGLRTPSKEFFD